MIPKRLKTLFRLLVLLAVIISVASKKKKNEDVDPEEILEDPPAPCMAHGNCTDLQFVLSARGLPMKTPLLALATAVPGANKLDPLDTLVEIVYWESLRPDENKTYTTSTQDNTLNPEWPDVVQVSYVEGQGQRVRFTVKDQENKEIGHASTSLKKIIAANENRFTIELVGPQEKNGKLIIHTLVNETLTEDTDERLGAAKSKKKSHRINLDKKPKKKGKKDKKRDRDEEDED